MQCVVEFHVCTNLPLCCTAVKVVATRADAARNASRTAVMEEAGADSRRPLQQYGEIITSSLARLPGLRLWQLGYHGVHDGSDQGRAFTIDQKHRLSARVGDLLDGKRRARRGDVLEQQPVVVDAPEQDAFAVEHVFAHHLVIGHLGDFPKKIQHVFEVFVG